MKNNIIIGSKSLFGFNSSEISFYNNIISCKYYGGYDSYVHPRFTFGKNESTIFIQDERLSENFEDPNNLNFHLKPTSTAVHAGIDGIDSGIYAGDFPFIDDGAPNLPTIYEMNIPRTASQKDGLSVEIKAKTN